MTDRLLRSNISTRRSTWKRSSDQQLMALLRLGDGDAFGALVRRYEERLLRTAAGIMKDHEDSENAVKEAFLKDYWKIETFRGEAIFSTWLTTIVINSFLMQLRTNRSRPHFFLDETGENGTAWVDCLRDHAVDTEASYANYETAELLSVAILRLKPNLGRVVEDCQQYECTIGEL
jgi:RNA polymerase sigma-70 factor, ECF subfamily